MTQTTLLKKSNPGWLLFDAEAVALGRLASKVAFRLMGKHKPTYTPHVDSGDHVVVINAAKVGLSGAKRETKTYEHYTGYSRGLKSVSLKDLMETKPEEVIVKAVKRMLPKGPLGKRMIRKLHVYRDADHGHASQSPVLVSCGGKNDE
jgi:large subunit ribosomal protein L13